MVCRGNNTPCSPPDLTTVLVFDAIKEAALSPCVDQMKCSLTVMIVKEHILECHLYHISAWSCQESRRLKSASKPLGCIN